MRIATVIGNRPQFVKAAAVSLPLRERHEEVLIHTGQHYDDELSRIFFDELKIPAPDRQLEIHDGSKPAQNERMLEQTARMLAALGPLFGELAPELVLVYGDTNSTLAGALAAAQLRIPVAHVEAGMRSFDRAMPEELNRVVRVGGGHGGCRRGAAPPPRPRPPAPPGGAAPPRGVCSLSAM